MHRRTHIHTNTDTHSHRHKVYCHFVTPHCTEKHYTNNKWHGRHGQPSNASNTKYSETKITLDRTAGMSKQQFLIMRRRGAVASNSANIVACNAKSLGNGWFSISIILVEPHQLKYLFEMVSFLPFFSLLRLTLCVFSARHQGKKIVRLTIYVVVCIWMDQ